MIRSLLVPNEPFEHNREFIEKELRLKGPPTIYAYEKDNNIICLEGSHRLAFSKDLGITPRIVIIDKREVICFDYSSNIFCLEKDLTEIYEDCIQRRITAEEQGQTNDSEIIMDCELLYYCDF